ncbi:hypothetical protein nbrc107696_39520 [Gordonia spumicola]|uniref:SARP family transcriptional regulator n=2 Tax=Gordonia spumicola TaxID=589161 RepID=A0A7I9VDS6_9ACTN|nr:hypothetical protein nbrc107696_39520 [Gordonia spumicola]
MTVIGLLGPVTVDGAGVPGLRARRLLVALVAADGRPVSANRLIDDVWGEAPPKSAGAALHTQISRLRPLIGDAALVGADGSYVLSGYETDLAAAERLLAEGDAEQASRLWRGTVGSDLGPGDGPADGLRAQARRLRARIDEALAHAAMARGDWPCATAIAQATIDDDPLDEAAHVLLMRALAADGRTSEALAAYSRLRRILAEELGADPGPEATAVNAELVSSVSPPVRRASQPRLRGDPLIGRDADVRAIRGLLSEHRVVTVQGPGGVGKTSIATTIGDLLAADGTSVFYIPLAAVRDDADLIGVVAAALGVGESDVRTSSVPRLMRRDLESSLGDALRSTDSVLVLDNCEQVIDACARLVDGLVADLPTLRVLVTSRSPLLIAPEQVYRLPVLDASPGVELFAARARSVRPDADLDPAAVADLCAHLDGLPLAIELAAARIRVMSVAEISAGLTERFELLRSADRTAPRRHRTLEAVIDWSWDLLDHTARRTLGRTCLFPDGFAIDAAEAVTGLSGARLADALTALVDQSLLHVDESGGRTRYRMLEMVREFGERRVDGTDEVVAAMSSWARTVCDDVRTRYESVPDTELAARIAVESENLVWVLRRAVAAADDATIVSVYPVLSAFWASRGLHHEAAAWGARIVDDLGPAPADPDEETRGAWQLTALIAILHLLPVGDLRRVAAASTTLRRLHRPDRVFDDVAELLSALVLARRPRAGYRLVVRALAPGRPDRIRWVALSVRFNVRENAGDLDGALADSIAVARLSARPDSFTAAMTDMTTGSLFGQQGRWADALERYRDAYRRLLALGADDDAHQVGGYIVAMLLSLGDVDGARAALDEISGGWGPADPTPQGNPETVAVMMVMTAEHLRLSGTGSTGEIVDVLRRAADLLLDDRAITQRDPGVMGCVTATVAARIRLGVTDGLDRALDDAAAAVIEMRDKSGWIDVPHSAGVVFVTGLYRCLRRPGDAEGTRLMALGLRLRPRHDYPAMHELIVDAERLSGSSAAEWASIVTECESMSRRTALDDVHGTFAERRAH